MSVGETENRTSASQGPTENSGGKSNLVTRWLRIPEVQVVISAVSIYTCYLYYGFLHEKMFKVEYGGEKFSYTIFLVFMQCVFNMVAAGIVLKIFPQEKRDTTPHSSYALVSLSYLGAMVCSFSALHYISYPMQVLVKSCKMIPVMVMGVFVSKRRYSWKETMCVLMITAGVAIFSYKPKAAQTGETSLIGILLLAASLICDGFTGPFQERIVAASNPTSHQMMFWQNFWAAVWLFAASAGSGQGVTGTLFFYRHPEALKDGFFFCLASAVGQNFIFYTVRNLSALTCTTITTTRKFFTLLVSLVFFKHSLNMRQVSAVVLVFTGIIWETVHKHQKKQAKLAAEKARAKAEKTE
mmetsp:Transcript_19911/g.28996  ORF Transcript_19911/g.28996 Transcript_19911/m.28996 type:complete len:354 (-) Transcript_19911:597-1658(-)